jgi:hypothetical protein
MTDLIAESQELLRRERMEAAAWRYGPWALGAALALILAVAGVQAWRAWDASAKHAQTAAFLEAAAQGPEALIAAADGMRPGLAAMARLTAGAPLTDAAPLELRELAALADPDTPLAKIEAIAARTGSPWRARAYVRAAALLAEAGDDTKAQTYLDAVAADEAASATLRARAQALDALYALRAEERAASPAPETLHTPPARPAIAPPPPKPAAPPAAPPGKPGA